MLGDLTLPLASLRRLSQPMWTLTKQQTARRARRRRESKRYSILVETNTHVTWHVHSVHFNKISHIRFDCSVYAVGLLSTVHISTISL